MRDQLTFLEQSTAFPNPLLDDVMPQLRDTEWRILCVVVRQTIGWKDGKGRKRADWLTQRQLMKRTGRASAAISSAIDDLTRRGLITVRSETGRVLNTAAIRRRYAGRMYFSVEWQETARGKGSVDNLFEKRTSISEYNKRNRNK